MDNRMINTNNETEVLKLYFEPRTWSFNDDCEHNVGSRSFMVGPDGVLAESYMIGDWWYHWTEIVSKTLLLRLIICVYHTIIHLHYLRLLCTVWQHGIRHTQTNDKVVHIICPTLFYQSSFQNAPASPEPELQFYVLAEWRGE